jgi:hypothetical protein
MPFDDEINCMAELGCWRPNLMRLKIFFAKCVVSWENQRAFNRRPLSSRSSIPASSNAVAMLAMLLEIGIRDHAQNQQSFAAKRWRLVRAHPGSSPASREPHGIAPQ